MLPSVSCATRSPTTRTSALVYGRGLSRPDAYQLVPYVTEDDSTNPATMAIGNPALKPSHANNYDVLFEQFLKPVGMIQAGVFYKQLSDPLVTDAVHADDAANYAGELVTQWINAGSAHLYGFEALVSAAPDAAARRARAASASSPTTAGRRRMSRRAGADRQSGAAAAGAEHVERQPDLRSRPLVGAPRPDLQRPEHLPVRATRPAVDPANLGPRGPAGDQYTYPHLQVDAQGDGRISRAA